MKSSFPKRRPQTAGVCVSPGEPPVTPNKKSIPGKTPKGAASENAGSRSGDNCFSAAMDGLLRSIETVWEKKPRSEGSIGRKWVYILNRQKAKTSISASMPFDYPKAVTGNARPCRRGVT